MKKFLAALAVVILPNVAWAACTNTVTVKDGAGATQTFCRGTDGGTNMIGAVNILDSAGSNFAGVTASNALKIDLSATGANATAIKVDGSAVTQPVSNAGTFATQAAQSGTWTVQPGNTANTTPWLVKPNDGTNSITVKAASTQAVSTDTSQVVMINPNQPTMTNPQPGNFSQIGGNTVSTNVGAADTGTQRVAVANSVGCTSKLVNTITASTDILTSVAKLHICSVVLMDSAAEQVSVVEGTGTTCATGTSALLGATTADATHGLPLAANGGISSISGIPWIETATTADHLCILKSGAGNLSYTITYADHS